MNDSLPLNISNKVTNWLKGLDALSSFQVLKCLQCSEEVSEVTFHVLNGASEKAYGSVIYQTSIYKSGKISTNLVISKSKAAPLRATSISRLELLSAALGLRLARKLLNVFQLSMDVVTFWCDSLNVLWWIREKSRRFKPFVANRISEIQSNTSLMMWKRVPTKINPADMVSRGTTVDVVDSNDFWLNGPSFLQKPMKEWPQMKLETVAEEKAELKKDRLYSNSVVTLATTLTANVCLFDRKKYSKWLKATRVLAWIQRFVSNCKLSGNYRELGELRVDEITEAETKIIKTMQQNEFAEEYKCLTLGKELSGSIKILPLNPRIHENGLIRSVGRLENTDDLPFGVKYPIILPRGNWITKLIVNYYHEKDHHVAGQNQTLAKISQRFWILRGREEVRECENNCYSCKRRKAKIAKQIVASFPTIRPKQPLRVFSKAADYGGPFITIQGSGRKRSKEIFVPFYMFIVTCCTLRDDVQSRHRFFCRCILPHG